jgi:hypothetical protein
MFVCVPADEMILDGLVTMEDRGMPGCQCYSIRQ